jgi:ribose/xylose/arabinose/galactoside ABC-type transport system permease subunit
MVKNLTKRKLNLHENIQKYFSFATILLLVIIFTILQPNFLNSANVVNLLSDSAPLMIMAAGMTPILLLGSIDLSIGAMCSVGNVFVLFLMMQFANNSSNTVVIILVAILFTTIFGILSGLLLGAIHVKLKVPSFIASLAFMSIWKSVALLISPAPEALPKKLYPSIEWYSLHLGPIGLPLILAVILIVVFYIVLTRTPLGKGIYAIGANERAARIAGIKVDQYKIIAFAMNGFCATLGAVFLMAKSKSAAPTVGDAFTLMVISAVVLGGTSLIGGAGNILKTIIGVFVVAIIKNGMNMVGVNVYWQKIVYGIIILIAIAISVDRSSRNYVVK